MSDLTILSRSDWRARDARPMTQRDPSTIRELFIHWPGDLPPSWRGTDQRAEEAQVWRNFQNFHMNTRGWSDIAYNYGMGGGRDEHVPRVWMLRGGRYQPAAQLGHNAGTLALVVLVGPNDPITDALISRLRSFVRWAEDYTGNRLHVGGHQQAPGQSTECPGPRLMAAIRSGKLDIH